MFKLKRPFTLLLSLFVLSAMAQKPLNSQFLTIDGVIKTKYEISTESQKSRFGVRTSQLGVYGQITEEFGYRAKLSLSDEGQFGILDLHGTFRPSYIKGLSVAVGQTYTPLHNSYVVSANHMMFANRAFIGKCFSSSRDLGVYLEYNFSLAGIPLGLDLGAYNGTKINNPMWNGNVATSGRFRVGSMDGFRTTVKFFHNPNSDDKGWFVGGDMRYETPSWKVEAEVMNKNTGHVDKNQFSYYAQGAYFFPLSGEGFIKYIAPAVRWDAIGRDVRNDGFEIKRLTTGLVFGLTKKHFNSLMRLDYEYYMNKDEITIKKLQGMASESKMTVELVLIF